MTTDDKTDLASVIPHSKWLALRESERILPAHIPHRNSTMPNGYAGTELKYRGMTETLKTCLGCGAIGSKPAQGKGLPYGH